MVNDFIFELGCEELPSAAVWPLADALANHIVAALDKAQLSYGEVKRYATPRRLAVIIHDLAAAQPSQNSVRRGPAANAAFDKDGKPTPALMGFAKSCGVEVAQLTRIDTDKGEWMVFESASAGSKTYDLLPNIVTQAISALPIAKPMRWGDGDAEFARPVHWAVMLYGDEVITHNILGISSSRCSQGHRFHHPQSIEIKSARDYEQQLKDAYVVADFAQRKAAIKQQIEQLASPFNASVIMPEQLLDEVTSIVEWPQALIAGFEPEFLDVPAEALIASMQSHQKCFALKDAAGKLMPYFITVSNIASTNPQQVIMGNEKVMRARLSDAAFFFRQDKKQALSGHIAATKNIVFQTKLGSVHDKVSRVDALVAYLTSPLSLDASQAARAVALSKCDLLSGMVGEFPELQGLMGYYYALNDGEHEHVARALDEQYMPRFAADQLPASPLGQALSLADRLDSLVGIFAIGQKPSGVKDPFKLRRHALATVRMLIHTAAQLKLSDLIAQAMSAYDKALIQDKSTLAELKPFMLDRLNSFYLAQNIRIDLVLAVRARQDEWLYDFDKRLKALTSFVGLPAAASLSAACKRVNNLLSHAQLISQLPALNESLLSAGAEQVLYQHVSQLKQTVEPLYQRGEYSAILTLLAELKEPVDAFFDHVMVMVDDEQIKQNRLALLVQLRDLLQGVADISMLQLS